MLCKVEGPCQGRNDEGHCTVWRDEGVSLRNIGHMLYGYKCNFQEQRKVKIPEKKRGYINPLKASKRGRR